MKKESIVSWHNPTWDVEELVFLKNSNNKKISVILPALNEEKTIGKLISDLTNISLKELVDEVIVIDSGSTDNTYQVAQQAGAKVYKAAEIYPTNLIIGKGEALWKSLAVAEGDYLVFIDADLTNSVTEYVVNLLGPLFYDVRVNLVKGFYRRPIKVGNEYNKTGGGRVTELTAKPLLAVLFPELAAISQPLSGEFSAKKDFLLDLDFPTDYGVDISILIDAWIKYGFTGINQVNLTLKEHRNRDYAELADMSKQIISTVLMKRGLNEKLDEKNISLGRIYRPSWNSILKRNKI